METQEQTVSKKMTSEGKGMKFLAGIGIVALVIAASWIGVQTLQFGTDITSGIANSLSGFSGTRSLFSNTDERLVLVADPSIVESEETFTLSWEHIQKEQQEGSYTFSYECIDDVYLTSPTSANVGEVIFCNAPFSFLSASNTLELSAVATSDNSINIDLELQFTPNGEDEVTTTGETRITVVQDKPQDADVAGATITTDSPEFELPISPPQTNTTVIVGGDFVPFNDPNGTPDLRVAILDVGTVTKSGVFTKKTGPLNPDDRLAVRFEIENVGTKDTGSWRFEVKLPTERSYTFESDLQEAILPGTRVEYILGFEDAEDDDDTGIIKVVIDPDDDIDEESESNNTDSITIEIES